MSPFVVGIDQGTTATKAYRLSADGDFQQLCSIEHRQIYPQPGWVEHDARELLAGVERCLESAGGVAAAGLDNQGETVIAWDADSGEPIHNAIVWQDNRTREVTDRLKAEGAEKITLERAGLPLDPYFSASKLRWILDRVPGAAALAKRGKLRLGTSDAFFLDRLCGRYATDIVTASRTSLMNLESGEWDAELCRLFGVPIHLLPPIRPNVGEFGVARRVNVPIVAGIVDQQAALFGHGCHTAGQAKITFGTGAFALAVTGTRPVSAPDSGLLPTVAWRLGAQTIYAVDGGVYNAGSALDWARRLGLFSQFNEIEEFEAPSAIDRGIVFVPALSGLACPYWDRTAAGLWLGMGLDTSSRDLVQAVFEGVALRSAQALAAMHSRLPLAPSVSIDGGLARNPYFCQFLANALKRTVVIPATVDLTGLGISRLTYLGAGLSNDGSVPPLAAPERTIAPRSPLPDDVHARFANAVERARGWRT
ncbi:MAG: FGGY family carbohydrate kinase, partial [Betaproteobacteria bacterium]